MVSENGYFTAYSNPRGSQVNDNIKPLPLSSKSKIGYCMAQKRQGLTYPDPLFVFDAPSLKSTSSVVFCIKS